MLKHTESDHADYQSLEISCKLMKDLASKINEVKRKEETFTKLFEIQKEVESCPVSFFSSTLSLNRAGITPPFYDDCSPPWCQPTESMSPI